MTTLAVVWPALVVYFGIDKICDTIKEATETIATAIREKGGAL